ncbi:uncharacterized protein PHALS_03257 [Plasmopara halstedii]|uniref:Uncharacterized protein n=1 Tax=Plasmopara halstedii TaxID=4781 RepID=A0A0P1AWN5_PLAHL|nr:uncharacterized protein PHALS_03257 [Plasmopara halstedii]CEG46650.1 hypothetical protein PHALS_03257 [Plasmopara halstedii]|eukprot:XP_024583019.1 hypothetical protein PHALS_03257 [Plasmopara halstedii]
MTYVSKDAGSRLNESGRSFQWVYPRVIKVRIALALYQDLQLWLFRQRALRYLWDWSTLYSSDSVFRIRNPSGWHSRALGEKSTLSNWFLLVRPTLKLATL